MSKNAGKFRLGWGDDVFGDVEFLPGGRVGESPCSGAEADLAGVMEKFRAVHGDDPESLARWFEHQNGLRGRGDGFWVEKARPDGTFASEDVDDDDDDDDELTG